ncbi:3-galactosyl-N-acetylglucosaminide 4-alpha-L-fucosyltransferase FUT3-like [Physella acuta]|uniref:3-galactosyl-N-acetylglucosaminide 4-alpha-L-fucosyltransferase FUT3-like n=1 Tax=Physella acuta TaxID=109671 RepID=UPI0027DD47E3|nr:3-galactosyl-N-acetylglucosaminide 4-alpha-L-fucosyltransferase FUT3-like [Physella acuta]XP_059139030.1 3-galactosyl-N-acetylglucosaminide 4-alpha-L-fucosyltransferase FUT3-like [Physella acuta]
MRTVFKVLVGVVVFILTVQLLMRWDVVTQKQKLVPQPDHVERKTLVKLEKASKKPAGDGRTEERVETGGSVSDDKTSNDVDDKEDEDEAEMRRLESSPYIYNEKRERLKMSRPMVDRSIKYVTYLNLPGKEHKKQTFNDCQYSLCNYTTNLTLADAVLTYGSFVRTYDFPTFDRPPGQRWIFFNFDPAIKNYNLDREEVKSVFNWTLTYQLSADIPVVYGLLGKYEPPFKDIDRIYDGKSKNVAWFVSHCNTWGLREVYVRRMSSVLPVDIFGDCGNLTCGAGYRFNDSALCLPMLSREYKFYLAFENSFCKDYVTEKFFKLFKDVDIIPVVRGDFNYKKYLPSGIFVDAADFSSPEELARYLLELGADKKRYTEMLRRKNRWRYVPEARLLCKVCEKLHTDQRTGHIESIKDKFNGSPSDCHEPTDLEHSTESSSYLAIL